MAASRWTPASRDDRTPASGDDRAQAPPFREMACEYVRRFGPCEVSARYDPPAWQVFDESTYRGAAYATYAWGADVVEVEVDPDTLEVRPLEATAVCEVGRVVHETLCRGQIEGGTLQAIGWALLEEMKMESGRCLNDRLATYIIPSFKDSPRMNVQLLASPWEGGPQGAKGVGELPMDGGAPAVIQAVENATGIRINALPATPERLYAWRRAGQTVDEGPGPRARRRPDGAGPRARRRPEGAGPRARRRPGGGGKLARAAAGRETRRENG